MAVDGGNAGVPHHLHDGEQVACSAPALRDVGRAGWQKLRNFAFLPNAGFWIAAVSVTVTLGIAGCLHVGLAGLAGMALGLAVGTLPMLAAYALKVR